MKRTTLQFFLLIVVLLLSISNTVLATNYYVSETGDDSNTGTSIASPFATIQHAVDMMNAGDVCFIRGGSYHEEVDLSGISGAEGNPITITNYEGEEVIMDGRVTVETVWTLETRASVSLPEGNDTPVDNIPGIGNVYVTTIDNSIGDITQLFVDNESMTLARWPNALAFSDDVFISLGETHARKSSAVHGEGTDMAVIHSLAETGVSVQGCVGIFGSVRLFTSHSAGSADFAHNNPIRLESGQKTYFIEGGLDNAERVLLDSEQEWAYDESTRKLTLWPKNNEDPNGLNISVRNQVDAFTGNANTKNIVIDGIDFFATNFDFNSSDNITIQNCDFTYYSISERALGGENNSKTADFTGSANDFCDNIIIYNCAFRYADGTGVNTNYINGLTFKNNLIYKAGYYTGQEWDEAGVRRNTNAFLARNSKDIFYCRNTVHTSGTNQTVSFGRYGTSSPEHPIVAEYNLNTKCCGLETDVSSMYIPEEDVHESVARYNWFIDNNRRDFRWDGANIDEVKTAKGNFYRNVGVQGTNPNKHAYKLKGDFHEIYNSIAIGDNWTFDIAEGKGGNANTVSRNNAADAWTTILSEDGFDWDLPGDDDKNYRPGSNGYVKSMYELLRDIDNRDFRPRADAIELIDQGEPVTCTVNGVEVNVTAGYIGSAPDIGAYEYGATSYWIPGRQEAQASSPIPMDKGVNVPVDADLMYLIGLGGAHAYVYVGTHPSNLSLIATNTEPMNITNLASTFALEDDRTYYWRVDTKLDDNSVVPGDVWVFSTGDVIEELVSAATITTLGATSFCYGDSVILSANEGAAYVWRNGTTVLSSTDKKLTVKESGSYTIEVTDFDGTVTTSDAVEVSVRLFSANEIIEAEDYCEMYGITVEDSPEGTPNVGAYGDGDWLAFNGVNLTGADSISIRYAGRNSVGGTLEIRTDSITGTLIGSISITKTANWQTYATVSAAITPTAGMQNVYLVVNGGTTGLMNFNWFQFTTDESIATQTIELIEGWNLVSLYVNPNVDAINRVSTVFANARIVKTMDAFYSSSQPDFLNSLSAIEAGVGYLVYNEIDETITINGVVETRHALSLQDGWNLIGVPSSTPLPLSTYPEAQITKDFDSFYEEGNAMSTLEELEPGKAYFVKK